LATGCYPPPKSSSTFVDDTHEHLILFGGRSMIHTDDIHLREQLHNELHSYSFASNCWTRHVDVNEPGPICDHSASMATDANGRTAMIVFGGSTVNIDQINQMSPQPSNELWQWTGVQSNRWSKIRVDGPTPEGRKGERTAGHVQ
jgi:hypothetical protein